MDERQIYETLWRQLEFVQDLVPWVFVVQIVYASIQFIVSICLLVGIMKKRPALMKPWLFITMFSLLAGFAVLCMAFVVMALGKLYPYFYNLLRIDSTQEIRGFSYRKIKANIFLIQSILIIKKSTFLEDFEGSLSEMDFETCYVGFKV